MLEDVGHKCPLVELRLQFPEGSHGKRVLWIQIDRGLVFAQRLARSSKCLVHAPEIEMRVKVTFISRSLHRALEPLNRRVEIALLDQVSSDVVVRVAKVRI